MRNNFLKWFFEKAQPMPGGNASFIDMPSGKPNRTIKAYMTEGYAQNVVVYRAINQVAAIATAEIEAVKGDDEETLVPDAPLLKLLQRPNPMQDGRAFLKKYIISLLVTGEAFVLRVGPKNGPPKQLWILPSECMTVEPGTSGLPIRYVYEVDRKKTVYPVHQMTGESDIMHHKFPNPNNIWRGMSPLEAAAYSVDIHNHGSQWNNALLKNSGRVSMVLMDKSTTSPDEGKIAKMRKYIMEVLAGPSNAGKLPYLFGGMELKELGKTAKDMDFIQGQDISARNIASAFGVPFPLVVPDSATYNNQKEAREMLWEDTNIPLAEDILGHFNHWLGAVFGDGATLRLNEDSITALEGKRERKYERMIKAVQGGVLDASEARVELGWPEEFPDGAMVEEDEAKAVAMTLARAGHKEDEIKRILVEDFNFNLPESTPDA